MMLPATAGSTQEFRLAGVMAAGPDRIGILEVPGGEQMLIRRGDVVPEGGRVESIESQAVRILFPSGVVELWLDGSQHPITMSPTAGLPETTGGGNIHVVKMDPDLVQQAVVRPPDLPAGPAPPTAQRRGRKDAGAELGRRFAPIAGLPADTRVLAVNEQPVTSAESAIREVNRSLEQGLPVRLNLANAQGPQHRVYLLPSTGEQEAQ